MLRSLFSGISSLSAHQTMLDVTGNNIANANTTGFKASRTQFQDTLSQMIQAGAAPQDGEGGMNPAQVGLGVQVAGTSTDFTAGAAQRTGRNLDMMIDGDGFFVVEQGGEQFFTRAGGFTLDAAGNLTTPGGAIVQGWGANAQGDIDVNAPLAGIQLPLATIMGAQETENVTFEGNLPADAEDGDVLTRGVEIYDAEGTVHNLEVAFTRDAAAESWTVEVAVDGTAVGNATVTFPDDASTPSLTEIGPLDIAGFDQDVTLDFSDISGYAELDTIEAASQDGQGAGTLQSFTMSSDGILIGDFSNGLKQPIGQVAVGAFANNDGLVKAGDSLLQAGIASGAAQIGVAGTGGRGALTGGAVEMSNVDLSQEFTNLIIAQRGFQAGSRVVTTSDEVLQELVNLKR